MYANNFKVAPLNNSKKWTHMVVAAEHALHLLT